MGALVFVGLDNWTGLGTFSLALPSVPTAVATVASMGWALVIGVVGALLGGRSALSVCRCARWCTSTGCW